MSSSFDFSGLSDTFAASIDIGDVESRPKTIPNLASAGQQARQPPVTKEKSASSFEISGSDLSGSIEIDDGDRLRSRLMGGTTTRGNPPAFQAPASQPFNQGGALQARGAGRTPGAQARILHRSRDGGGFSDSLSLSAVSSDELLADLDITDGGGGPSRGGRGRESTVEVLSFGGSKVTKTRIIRDGLAQEAIRESIQTVVMSEPESILSLSGGTLGKGSGNLTIEYSEDMATGHVDTRPGQGPRRLGQGPAPSAVAAASSSTVDYDEEVLGSGDIGIEGVGNANIKYDSSVSNGEASKVVSIATVGRQPMGRQQLSVARYDVSKTPSISGSTSLSSIGVDSAVPGPGHGGVLRSPAPTHPPRPAQPDPLGRTTASLRLSRPVSISGLTAEPVFASGSSHSGVTPSISSGDGGGDVRTSNGGDALGASVLDASALDAASGELYDTSGSANVRQSVDIGGDGRGAMSRSWDRSDRSRSGRRAVDSGGASSSRSSRRTSSIGSMSYGIGGVRLRGIDELGVPNEVPGGGFYNEDDTEKEVGTSYGDDGNSKSGEMRQPMMAALVQQWPKGERADSSGSEFERIRGGRDLNLAARQENSTDSSLARLRNLKSTSRISSGTAVGSGSRGGVAVGSRYVGGSSSSSSRGESVVLEPLSSVRDYVSNASSSSSSKRSGVQAHSRSEHSRTSYSSSTSQGADVEVGHDLLAGMEMVRERSSSSDVDKLMTVDELMAHSISDNDISGGSRHGPPASGSFSADSNEYDDDFTAESVRTESVGAATGDRHSHALSRTGSSQRGAAGGPSDGGLSGLPQRLGTRQREFSFGRQEGAVADGGGTPRQLPQTILISRSPSGAESPSGDSGNGRGPAGRGKDGKNVSAEAADAGGTTSRPASQLQLRAVPDPRFAVMADSGSHGSIEEEGDDTLMASPVRSPGHRDEDEIAGWRQQNVQLQQSDALSSDHSSPSLSRENHRGRRHLADPLGSPSATFDASTSRLSQSGTLGPIPVAPGWATISAGGQHGRASPDGLNGGAAGLGPLTGADNQFSRDSDLSEEFIPSQAMQRGLQEQPIFRPLMPNVPTPRASTGALGAVPAFTARGTIGVPSEPRASPTSRSPSPPLASSQLRSQRAFPDPHYHPTEPHQHRPPPEQLSPVVAAAAAPPPPRHAFAATQTDVYTHVVDLDPIPRPGTVKLRTVAVQWGTLNEVSTQVTFDPVSDRLVEASAGLYDTEELPEHLRHQLQAHLLQQQQLHGPFTKRGLGRASGLLQAGTDSLLLGNGAPFSGIGPGFGILSLAFHSVRTAALLEQLERSLTGAATAAGVTPPPAYPPHPMTGAGTTPYYPYGWWPAHPGTAAPPPPPLQTPGQAAAAAYAANATAQPSSPPSDATPSPAAPSPQHSAGAGDADGATAAAGLQRSSANWPTLTTVASYVTGSGASRPASPLPLTSPSRLRAMSTSLADISSVRGSAAVKHGSSGNIGSDVATGVISGPTHVGPSRRSRLSSSDMISGTIMGGAGGLSRRKRSSSPTLGGPNSYARSAASTRRSGSDGSGSDGEYSTDFEDVEEESGVTGGGSVEDTVAELEDTAATTTGLGEVEELVEAAAAVVDDESIPEEEVGDGSGSSDRDSSGRYSEDFETESAPTQSHPHSHSRTASLHRSSLVGSSNRGKLNPALSANSFSGRSLLRRGSVVLPTLAPIVGSEGASREDEEDGSPSQGSRMLSRVGSIIKSSSGFKRTASISITMADDPLLPNQMARILPKSFSTNASGSAATGGLSAQPSNRQLLVDGAGRGQHPSLHHGAVATEALSEGTIASATTAAAGDQLLQQPPEYAMPPPSPYAPFYPYPPIPYGSPYGLPYPPYPPYPAPPVAPTPAANVASVLQYLPPSIPHVYPPYPSPLQPTTAPTSTFGSAPGSHIGPGRATGAPPPTGGPFRPASAMATSLSQHQHQHLQHPHGHNLHVKFADGLAPGDGTRSNDGTTAAPTAPPQLLGARDPNGIGGFGPHVSVAGVAQHSSQPHQQEQQHVPKRQQPYVSSSPGGIPTTGPFLGYGGYGAGGSSLFSAQNTLQRFGAVLSSGSFPGLDPATVRTIQTDLVKTAAAVSGQLGYEDIVVEAGAIDEYRAQLARVKARLAAARAMMPSVIPIQEKVVLLKTAAPAGAPGAMVPPEQQKTTTAQPPQSTLGSSRIMAVSTTAPGSYRYTTLEDTRRLIDATRPHRALGVS